MTLPFATTALQTQTLISAGTNLSMTLSEFAGASLTGEDILLNGSNMRDLAGFEGLSPADQQALLSLGGDPAADAQTVTRIFGKILPDASRGHRGNFVDSWAGVMGVGSRDEGLFPGYRRAHSVNVSPIHDPAYRRETGSVLGNVSVLLHNRFTVGQLGIGEKLEEPERRHGVEHILRSTMVPEISYPKSVAEGKEIYDRSGIAENDDSDAFVERQLSRMTETEKAAYMEFRAVVDELFAQEKTEELEPYFEQVNHVETVIREQLDAEIEFLSTVLQKLGTSSDTSGIYIQIKDIAEDRPELAEILSEVRSALQTGDVATLRLRFESQLAARRNYRENHQHGRPNPEPLNDAQWKLDETIRKASTLQKLGIGPHEYQILAQHRRARAALSNPKAHQYLLEQAYGQEMEYVILTIMSRVTELRLAKRPPSEWKYLENRALRAGELYERLIEGKHILSTDHEELEKLRKRYFNHGNWEQEARMMPGGAADLEAIRAAEAFYDAHRDLYKGIGKTYVSLMGPISQKCLDAAEQYSMKYAAAELEFQKVHLHEQLARLRDGIKADDPKADISAEHMEHMNFLLTTYERCLEDYLEYWKAFASGEDVKAREHARNSKDKKTLFDLAFGVQLFLEDLYAFYGKHYNLEMDGVKARPSWVGVTNGSTPVGTEKLHEDRPSWVSVSYNNTIRTMDEAIEQHQVSGAGIEKFFSAFWDRAVDAAQAIGLRVPGTRVSLSTIKVMDSTRVDHLAGLAGGAFVEKKDGTVLGGQTIYYGLKGLTSLAIQTPPHPDVAMMEGAQQVFPDNYFERQNMSRESILFLPNHTGVEEFPTMVGLGLMGIEAPQAVQEGVAVIPVFGDYCEGRAVVFERGQGNEKTNDKIIQFLLRKKPLLFYPAGTRIVSAAGTPVYHNDPHAMRIVTDRFTTGLAPKIALKLQERAEETGQDFLVVNMVHGGSLNQPEPTWFLGTGAVDMVMGNLSDLTTMNFLRKDEPRRIGFGLVLSSQSFLTETEWREQYPQHFVNGGGREMSKRERYFQTLQLNAAVLTMDQRLTAAGMMLASAPKPNEAQLAKAAQIGELSEDQRIRLTTEPMNKHRELRIEGIEARNPEAFERTAIEEEKRLAREEGRRPEKTKRPLGELSADERAHLESALSTADAEKLLSRMEGPTGVRFGNPKKERKDGTVKITPEGRRARRRMLEAIQRGASYAQQAPRQRLALDGDKVLWDHFFAVDPMETPEIVRNFVADFMSRPTDPDIAEQVRVMRERFGDKITLQEHINLKPSWVAFLLGYHAVTGESPVLYSSSISPRLQALAGEIDNNRLVQSLFSVLLNDENITSAQAQAQLTPEAIAENPGILLRSDIASYGNQLLDRFADAQYDLEAEQDGNPVFSDVEKEDVMTLLKSKGDLHFKLRGLYPYDVLVDDRRENVAQANDYDDDVWVLQPEPWTSSKLNLYVSTNVETNISFRNNQGRSGQSLDVIRRLERGGQDDGLVTFKAKEKKDKIRHLIDKPTHVEYGLGTALQHYQEEQVGITQRIRSMRDEIRRRAHDERRNQLAARRELAAIIQTAQQNGALTLPPARSRNVRDLLNPPADQKLRDIAASETDLEIVALPVALIADEDLRTRAEAQLDILKQRHFVQLANDMRSRKKGGVSRAMSSVGKQLGPTLAALGDMCKHLIGDALQGEVGTTRWEQVWNFATDSEKRLLIRLGAQLKGEKILFVPDLPDRKAAVAYSIVAERLFIKYGTRILEKLISAKDSKVPAETKEEKLELIHKTAADLRKSIVAAYHVWEKVQEFLDSAKPLWENLRDLVSGDIREGLGQETTVYFSKIFGDVVKQREAYGTPVRKLQAHNIAQHIVENFLEECIRLVGGDTTPIGNTLRRAKIALNERGLQEAIPDFVDVLNESSVFRRYPRLLGSASERISESRLSKEIARHLERGNIDTAQQLLSYRAHLLRAQYPDDGSDRFKTLVKATLASSSELDHKTLILMANQIATEVFPVLMTGRAANE